MIRTTGLTSGNVPIADHGRAKYRSFDSVSRMKPRETALGMAAPFEE
jgi:hypothetical protein